MGKPWHISAREAAALLRNWGFTKVRTNGGHDIYEHPTTGRCVPIRAIGRNYSDLPHAVAEEAADILGISIAEFKRGPAGAERIAKRQARLAEVRRKEQKTMEKAYEKVAEATGPKVEQNGLARGPGGEPEAKVEAEAKTAGATAGATAKTRQRSTHKTYAQSTLRRYAPGVLHLIKDNDGVELSISQIAYHFGLDRASASRIVQVLAIEHPDEVEQTRVGWVRARGGVKTGRSPLPVAPAVGRARTVDEVLNRAKVTASRRQVLETLIKLGGIVTETGPRAEQRKGAMSASDVLQARLRKDYSRDAMAQGAFTGLIAKMVGDGQVDRIKSTPGTRWVQAIHLVDPLLLPVTVAEKMAKTVEAIRVKNAARDDERDEIAEAKAKNAAKPARSTPKAPVEVKAEPRVEHAHAEWEAEKAAREARRQVEQSTPAIARPQPVPSSTVDVSDEALDATLEAILGGPVSLSGTFTLVRATLQAVEDWKAATRALVEHLVGS